MFKEIYLSQTAAIYQAAPLAEQRERYLRHLNEIGSCRYTLRKCANSQLSLVRILDLQEGDRVCIPRVEAAAAIWAQPKGRQCSQAATAKARQRFVGSGTRWLRFLGWLDEPEGNNHPHHAEVTAFEDWLRRERGLSEETIECYCRAADRFFFWLAGRDRPLDVVQMVDIDDAFASEHRRGVWSRRTVHNNAQFLRAFFLFAEARDWCRAGLAAGIMPSIHGRRDCAKGHQARRRSTATGISSGGSAHRQA